MSICYISGDITNEPMVSIKSGHVFDKRLILKYVETHNTCPATKQPLTVDDLISIQSSTVISKPKLPTAHSFPSMLEALQNEWDACLLETFNLRQQLNNMRQELAHALYKEDAALRVIAGLVKERDDLRLALTQIDGNIQKAVVSTFKNVPTPAHTTSSNDDMNDNDTSIAGIVDNVDVGMSPRIVKEIEESWASLQGKNRKAANKLRNTVCAPVIEQITSLSVKKTVEVSNSTSVSTNSNFNPNSTVSEDISIVGHDNDGVTIINHSTDAKHHVSTGKAVTHVITPKVVGGDMPFVAFAIDKNTVYRISTSQEDGKPYHLSTKRQIGNSTITSIDIHPSNAFLVLTCLDKHIYVIDFVTLETRLDVPTEDVLTTGAFHPDGKLYSAANSSKLVIYNVPDFSVALSLDQENIQQIKWSQNGYSCIVSDGKCVNMWDIRKSIISQTKSYVDVGEVRHISLDMSSSLITVVTDKNVELLNTKDFSTKNLFELVEPTDAEWTQDDKSLIITTNTAVLQYSL